jgi:hypothetical protein
MSKDKPGGEGGMCALRPTKNKFKAEGGKIGTISEI